MGEALQSLNRILQYRQSRDRADVQEALQFMQFAQQKKAFDMQSASQNIELLSKMNTQYKLKSASTFAQDSQLSSLYSEFSDETDGMTQAVAKLTDKSLFWGKDKDIGMDKSIAIDLVSATWSLYGDAKNPDALINIGSKLSPDKKITPYNTKLQKALMALGYVGDENKREIEFQDMNKALENENNIMLETQEFIKGDFQIQKDFDFNQGVLNRLEEEAPTIQNALNNLTPKKETQVENVLGPDSQLRQTQDLIKSKKDELSNKKQNIKDLKSNIFEASMLKKRGYNLTESQIRATEGGDEATLEWSADIELLSEDIENLEKTKKEINKDLRSISDERVWRLSDVDRLPKYLP